MIAEATDFEATLATAVLWWRKKSIARESESPADVLSTEPPEPQTISAQREPPGDFILKSLEAMNVEYPDDVWIVDKEHFHLTYD